MEIDGPDLFTFEHYDPASPTLQRSPICGDCMRGIIHPRYVTAFTDHAAPIRSGDFVRLWIKYHDGDVQAIIKRLRVSRSGTWWGECSDGVFQIGTLVTPFRMDRVVAFSAEQLVHLTPVRIREASEEERAHFAEEARGVRAEWAEHGHVDGVPFPGLDVVNHDSPNYRPPQELAA